MRIAFFGYHEAICGCFEKAMQMNEKVSGVVTGDLKESCWYRSIEDLAREKNVPILKPIKIDQDLVNAVKKMDLDLIVVIDFHKLITPEILNLPRKGCINFHASLLPKYRGNAPLIRAICNNDSLAGTTMHYLSSEYDSGDIIAQKSFEILSLDTIESVILKHNKACVELFEKYIPLLACGKAPRIKQLDLEHPAYKWRYNNDAKINLSDSSLLAYNKIRALASPFPKAFFEVDGKRVYVDITKIEEIE